MKLIMPFLTVAATVATLLPSCKKNDCFDNPATRICLIEKITGDFNLVLSADQVGVFEYNLNNDPVSFKKAQIGSGNPDLIFLYDNKKRLTDFIAVYKPGAGFERWHRYKYSNNDSNNDRMIEDSLYTLGSFENDNPKNYYSATVTHVELDSKGRLKGNYGSDGNLVGGAYDNKINWHRANRVFQLIDRDYNANNPLPFNATYNSLGLPVKITNGLKTPTYFLEMSFDHIQIDYGCK